MNFVHSSEEMFFDRVQLHSTDDSSTTARSDHTCNHVFGAHFGSTYSVETMKRCTSASECIHERFVLCHGKRRSSISSSTCSGPGCLPVRPGCLYTSYNGCILETRSKMSHVGAAAAARVLLLSTAMNPLPRLAYLYGAPGQQPLLQSAHLPLHT